MTHTPGPWRAFQDASSLRHTVGTATGRICDMWGREPAFYTDEDAANARLIASAPELLESLQDLMFAEGGEAGQTAEQLEAWAQAEAAIAKATGQRRSDALL